MAGRGRMDPEECKMFVGGLTKDTTADMLKGYFSYYGRIVHAVVMTNPETKKSRGFGFVSFERPDIVDHVLMSGPHFLDGKQIDPKPSVPKDLRPKPPQVEQPKKAFLGGLPLEMNETDLREYFSQYGVVTECYIMFDEKRMKSRGFGFVSFEDETIIDGLVSQHYIDVRDKKVEIKLARPRENPLAPLNSEGRVLSADVQQQRMAAVAAATAPRRPYRPQDPHFYDFSSNYPPYDHRPDDYYGGPPAAKRPRVGAHTPPLHSPVRTGLYSGAGYDGYGDSSRGYGHSASTNPKVGPSTKALPSGQGASSSSSVLPFPLSFSSSSTQNGPSADGSAMTPESMTALMQQTMQNMGGNVGMNMNMMMPMVMSNMMTQMFMNQAQTMFQSVMQKKTEAGVSKAEEQTAGSSSTSDMMDAMKNVLQSLMSTMQQHQEKQPKSESSGK